MTTGGRFNASGLTLEEALAGQERHELLVKQRTSKAQIEQVNKWLMARLLMIHDG